MISSTDLSTRWSTDPHYRALLDSIVKQVPAIEWVQMCPALEHPNHHGEANDLRGIPLASQEFNAPDYDLSDSILSGADFSGAVLHGTWMQASILDEATFRRAKLVRTQLLQAHGKHVDFTGATIKEATIKLGKIVHSSFDDVRVDSSDLSQADLSSCSFINVRAENCRIGSSNLQKTDLQRAHFANCDFSASSMQDSRLTDAAFLNCDLSGVDFRGARLNGTVIQGGQFGAIGNGGLATTTKFDDTPEIRSLVARSGATGIDQIEWRETPQPSRSSVRAGDPCPHSGFWFTPAKLGSRRLFQEGELMPSFSSDYGATLWQWDPNQDPGSY